MKTNEEAKQEAIKAAYVPKHVTEQEFEKMEPFIDSKTGWFNAFEYSRETGKPSKWYKEFLPEDAKDIASNNGWTRIEHDGSNLPERDKEYKVIAYDGRVYGAYYSSLGLWLNNKHNIMSKLSNVTHYKPIIEDPKPIY